MNTFLHPFTLHNALQSNPSAVSRLVLPARLLEAGQQLLKCLAGIYRHLRQALANLAEGCSMARWNLCKAGKDMKSEKHQSRVEIRLVTSAKYLTVCCR